MAINDYELSLRNCRSIRQAEPLVLKEQSLNVFFAKNGAGKTTIARALFHVAENTEESLRALESFDYMESGDPSLAPKALCSRRIKQIDIFNREWVEAHCFKESTVHEGAYELYVCDKEYRKIEHERDKLLRILESKLFSDTTDSLLVDIKAIMKGIGKATTQKVIKTSQVFKAYKRGVPIGETPPFLKPVIAGMSISEQAEWLDWHISRPATHAPGLCPYCGNDNIDMISECVEYDDDRDSDAVSSWANLATLFDEHSEIFARKVLSKARRILSNSEKPTENDLLFLISISVEAKKVADAIDQMKKALHDEDLVEADILIAALKSHAKTLDECSIFRSSVKGNKSSQKKAIMAITLAVEKLADQQNQLKRLSDSLRDKAVKNISGHESEINDFLKRCGYRYRVAIQTSIASADAKVLLLADRATSHHLVSSPGDALSYGERNAFALALFALEVVGKPGGIAVLDDPISSFDQDKRFGILYMLFSNKSNVFSANLLSSNKTVLVLTHDYLVVSELAHITKRQFSKRRKLIWYLTCDASGMLTKQKIDDESFSPYVEMLNSRIRLSRDKDPVIGLMYIRSLCEMLRKKPGEKKTKWGISFILLSEIIHGRSQDEILERVKWSNVSDGKMQVKTCENLVKSLTDWDFDYWKTVDLCHDNVSELVDVYEKCDSSYEKLQIVRMILERDDSLNELGKVMERFADETCHIGGDYLFQLDPVEYDQVPFYVLDWCEDIVAAAHSKSSNLERELAKIS